MSDEHIIIDSQPAPEEVQAETPVDESTPEVTPEVNEQPEEDVEEEEHLPRKKTGIQRQRERINRLEAELQAVKSQYQQPKVEEPALKEPKMEDYDSLEAYDRDREAYLEAKILKRFEETQRKQEEARKSEDKNKKINGAFDEARSKFADFEEKMEDIRHLPVLPAALTAIAREGSELLYALVSDPDRYEAISRMDPDDQAYEIASIAATIRKPKAEPKKSNAPKPIAPVKPTTIPSSLKAQRDDIEFY